MTVRRDEGEVLDGVELEQARLPWPDNWSPEGVLEALEPMVSDTRRAKLQEVLGRRLGSVVVVLDGPHDPHNGAAIMRSCDAFGIQEMFVVPREDFLVSGRIAKGTQRWVDVTENADAAETARGLTERGFELITTHPDGELLPEDLRTRGKIALVFGNEHQGVGPELTASATSSVRIPMRGFVESLNMSVSAAVLLAAAVRDRPGDLPTELQRLLYARGIYWSLNRARDILAALPPR